MRAPLSVIIPTLNAAEALQRSLPALTEGLSAGLVRELIISDGGSMDATRRIAEEAGAVLLSSATGRGGQLRRGSESANGEWLLFLHADTLLPPGWSAAVLAHLADAERAAYFHLRFAAQGTAPRIVAGWANVRSRVFGLPYGDQGLLISRALYDRIGGYQDIPLMEDVAIARALKGRLTSLPVVATTSAEKYLRDGWVRRGIRNLITLGRYLTGTDPDVLVDSYNRGRAD
jgi:rSAM/selenodomain-associated transferase 2